MPGHPGSKSKARLTKRTIASSRNCLPQSETFRHNNGLNQQRGLSEPEVIMRSCLIVIFACLIFGVAPSSRSQTAPAQSDLEREIARLRDEVTQLRRKVAELEDKVSERERNFPGWRAPRTQPFRNTPRCAPAVPTPRAPPVPMPPAPLVPIPPNGERREF